MQLIGYRWGAGYLQILESQELDRHWKGMASQWRDHQNAWIGTCWMGRLGKSRDERMQIPRGGILKWALRVILCAV